MKKFIAILVAIILIVSCVPFSNQRTSAEEYNNLTYFIYESQFAVITGGEPVNGVLTIPSSIAGYPVKNINSNAFENNRDIVTLNLPDSLIIISEYAFKGCSSIKNFVIPINVYSILLEAFAGCNSLTSVDIPQNVIEMYVDAFSGCTGLTQINVDSDNPTFSSIDGCLFDKSGKSLMLVPGGKSGVYTIPDGTQTIEIWALREPSKVTGFLVNNGNSAFSSHDGVLFNKDATTLVKCPLNRNGIFVIPQTVTKIGFEAFRYCQNLTGVLIPDSVTHIDYQAFMGCNGLSTITIPKNVIEFGHWPFRECANLKTVTFYSAPEVPSGMDPFFECNKLSSVFVFCEWKQSVLYYFTDRSDDFIVYNNHDSAGWDRLYNTRYDEFDASVKYKITYLSNGATSGTVPVDNQSYDFNTFFTVKANEGNLAKPNLEFLGWNTCADGTGVDYMAGSTFYTRNKNIVLYAMWSESLALGEPQEWTSNGVTWSYTPMGASFCSVDAVNPVSPNLVIPNFINGKKVIMINDLAFMLNDSLSSITLPEGLLTIGNMTFYGCSSLEYINIPASVSYVEIGAFAGCTSLYGIYVNQENVYYSSYKGILFNKDKTVLYCCPIMAYATIPKSVLTLSELSFMGCDRYEGLVLPPNLISIGDYAFYSCQFLNYVNIPASVTSIGEYSFYSCASLIDIAVDRNNDFYASSDAALYNKGKTVLLQCPGGKSGRFTIADSVMQINDIALSSCYNITEFQIGSANTTFSSMNGVLFNKNKSTLYQYPIGKTGNYNIPSSVTNIRDGAFLWCMGLTGVVIPTSVTSIGLQAFFGCVELTSVIIPDKVASIGDYAFTLCNKLATATFNGNAPVMGEGVFVLCAEGFKIYYLAGKTGYSSPLWNDYPSEAYSLFTSISSSAFSTNASSGFLSKINSETSINTLLNGLNEKAFIKVFKGTGEVSGNTLIGTGMTVDLMDRGVLKQRLIVVVTGDINGDGKITLTDFVQLKSHILGKSVLTNCYAKAADMNGDGNITLTDFVKAKAHLLGKELITPRSY